jgi:glucose-6-phosphate isomerase
MQSLMHEPLVKPPHGRAWQRLQALAERGVPHLRALVASGDPERARWLSCSAAGIAFDGHYQAVTAEVLEALFALAREAGVLSWRDAMFAGERVNVTEQRAALHVALRGSHEPSPPWGQAISEAVQAELQRFLSAAEAIRRGDWEPSRGGRITDVVNIGIGGSDLGPRMACHALAVDADAPVRVHFVSNPDPWALYRTLQGLRGQQTLFIVQSKTFTTPETLMLANSARQWLHDQGLGTPSQQAAHLLAVTANPPAAAAQGFLPAQTFQFWDWVGGRYSLWSSIGLPLAIAIGREAFLALLRGAHAMDQHFRSAALEHNLPVLMAMLGIWNRNFQACPTKLIAVYASRLALLVPFLQQLDMESNGKSRHIDGSRVEVGTGPIVWGGLGIDGQHAYFQLLHQGTHRVPIDFIGVRDDHSPLPLSQEHQKLVQASMAAQARALAIGRNADETRQAIASQVPAQALERAVALRAFDGNVPSSTLWLQRLDAYHLGALVALYEHVILCQAAVWKINPFDQWGVELGKAMLAELLRDPA